MKLKQEDKDSLLDIIHSDGIKVIPALCDVIVDAMKNDLINYDLSNGDEKELVRRKYRIEGAVKLAWALKERLRLLAEAKE